MFNICSYCQGTGTIAASLLLLLEEEDAFWMMATIVEDLLPASYYSSTLLGNIPLSFSYHSCFFLTLSKFLSAFLKFCFASFLLFFF